MFLALILIVVALVSSQRVAVSTACHGRALEKGKLVCVCDGQTCHDLKFNWPTNSGHGILVRSSEEGRRFEVSELPRSNDSGHETSGAKILIRLQDEYQPILGWGGAITDAAAINYRNLNEAARGKLMQSYYGHNGLQYNLLRVPIAGSDFSTRPYSYDDVNHTDYGLKGFNLAPEDLEYKIPFIREAIKLAQQYGTDIKIFGSPWSPPEWMKTNKNFIRGELIDTHLIYEAYAKYLLLFFDTYENLGIKFWGATVQNEPVAASLPIYFFNSLQFKNKPLIKFISQYLGPALEASGRTKDKFKLMVGDDSLGLINLQVPVIMKSPEVQKYVSGLAFHWYTSGTLVPYDALNSVYDDIKDKIEFVMMSEACTGSAPLEMKVDLGSWDRAQAYASDIIEDLSRHTGAWVDWNLALDVHGGPNWAGNFVDSPIIVNATSGEFYKQPMYYALAHFSRFFMPRSIRVGSEIQGSVGNSLKAVAVHNKETGHLAVNILNTSDRNQKVSLAFDDPHNSSQTLTVLQVTVEGKSINSIAYKL